MFYNPHPFLLFLLFLLAYFGTVIFIVYGVFIIAAMAAKTYERTMFKKMECMVSRNPDLGLQDKDGNFVFRRRDLALTYKVTEPDDGTGLKKVEALFLERRLTHHENKLRNLKERIVQLWSSGNFIDILEPRFLTPLVLVGLVLYFNVFQPEHFRERLIESAVSRLLGIDAKSVKVQPDGIITISANRMDPSDGSIMPVSFNFNIADWAVSEKVGYVTVKGGAAGSGEHVYGTYPVTLDNNGNITVRKDDRLIKGKYTKDEIIWDEPIPTGVNGKYLLGHNIVHLNNNEILIEDNKM